MKRASFSLGRQAPARRRTLIPSTLLRGTPRAEAEVHAKPSPSKTAELTETGTPLPLSKTPPPPPFGTASLLLPLDVPGLSETCLSAGSVEGNSATAREADWLASLSAWLHHL